MIKSFNFPFKNLNDFEFNLLFNSLFIPDNQNNSIYSSDLGNRYIYPSELSNKKEIRNTFSILTVNIRSLNKNFYKLKLLLIKLKFDPTVIIVSETWINKSKPFLYSLDNYIFLNKPSNSKSGGSGIFLRNNLNYTILENLDLKLMNCENLWLKLNLSLNKSIVIASIYRHPSHEIKTFQDKLLHNIATLNNSNQHFVIGGDININLLKNNPNINSYKIHILSQGAVQLVNLPTRLCYKSNTLIDHIYSNIPEEKTLTNCIIYDISDHLPIITYLKHYQSKKPDTKRKVFRDLNKINYDQLSQDLQQNLNTLPYSNLNVSANELWDSFENIFNKTLDKHAPLRIQTRKEVKKSFSPWLNKNIICSIKTRQKLYKKAIKTSKLIDWTNFRSYRNKLNRTIKLEKQNYYKSEIIKSKSNIKRTWKTMNKIINLKQNTNTSNEIKVYDDTNSLVTCPKKVGNIFNHFFTTVGSNLSKNISAPISNNTSNLINQNHSKIKESFFLNAITPKEVEQYILQMDPKKAIKSDCIPTKVIQMTSPIIAPVLSELFNRCIKESVFPDKLKSAEVHPIYKKGNKFLTTNHRPISTLSPFSKIFEKHILNQLTKFINKHNILHSFQYGFRKNSSTEMALTQITDEISNRMEDGQITCAIFLDLAKAFDTVDHNILLNKLNKYGVRGLPAKLITNYLQNRTQQTVIDNIKSDVLKINCGVPQGSILGPPIFNLYINDIVEASKFTIKLFADDACLLYSSKDPKQLEIIVNNELNKIDLWRKSNKLSINFTKSNYIIFTGKITKHKFKIKMDNNILERTNETKYLGIILDNKLK